VHQVYQFYSKTTKNRLAKPKKIRFDISFANGESLYWLDAFCRDEYFEQIGIAKGKMNVDKQVKWHFVPGRLWYGHLDKSFNTKQLFKPEIFTQEVLEKMEPIVKWII
jgi:hypothetical protein